MDLNADIEYLHQTIKIRTAEGFIYKGKRIIYEVWFKHIFRDYEEIQ